MGLIIDSSVLIASERQGQNVRQMLAAISGRAGNLDIAISVVTLIEMAHGTVRADTLQRKENRQQFIHELLTALPVHPVTVSLALRVGQIDGENQAKGIRVPLSDLLIGVTALELGYSVATAIDVVTSYMRQLPHTRGNNPSAFSVSAFVYL
jgi:tRNA(fMet)-specific endonuclease VapC